MRPRKTATIPKITERKDKGKMENKENTELELIEYTEGGELPAEMEKELSNGKEGK